MRKLNIGMIGYGSIGRVHAMAYRAIPFHYALPADSINIVAVATTRRETAQQAARGIGCDVWTADYEELLTRDDVDVVDISVPNHKHEEIVTVAAPPCSTWARTCWIWFIICRGISAPCRPRSTP
jgi:predicted dehydrogenase